MTRVCPIHGDAHGLSWCDIDGCDRPTVVANDITTIQERIYDRANPARYGTASKFDRESFEYFVKWDDGSEAWVHVDDLGAVRCFPQRDQ